MKYINNLIIGSGISALISFQTNKKNSQIYSGTINKVVCSNKFYEYDSIGGNTNIWGGYLNYKRHKKFLKDKNYKKLFKNNIFQINKIFTEKSKFSNTFCLTDSKKEIFRIKKNFFKNKLIEKKIKKITIKKKNIELITENNKTLFTKKLTLCIGNLNLIKLMHQSSLINSDDIISFEDGSCSYVLNFFIKQEKNYYIPMPFKQITEKLIFDRAVSYKVSKSSLILQKFSNSVNKHKIKCDDLMNMNINSMRYFLSNHIANLRINNVPIRKFIKLQSKKIDVYCSGTVKKYLPGPIIQDLILDILNNK